MGRKIKKVIMIAAFGMVTGGQIADLLPEGNVMQVEAGSRKQIIKVKNKGNTIFLKEGTSELGLGTGFIVTSEGYIVTNQHVSGDKNSTEKIRRKIERKTIRKMTGKIRRRMMKKMTGKTRRRMTRKRMEKIRRRMTRKRMGKTRRKMTRKMTGKT